MGVPKSYFWFVDPLKKCHRMLSLYAKTYYMYSASFILLNNTGFDSHFEYDVTASCDRIMSLWVKPESHDEICRERELFFSRFAIYSKICYFTTEVTASYFGNGQSIQSMVKFNENEPDCYWKISFRFHGCFPSVIPDGLEPLQFFLSLPKVDYY